MRNYKATIDSEHVVETYSRVKLLLVFVMIVLTTASCMPVKVANVEKGKQLHRAEICTPEFALLELLRRPQIGLNKTNTGYNHILFEDEEYIYWGYLRVDNWLNRTVKPFYKTSKSAFKEAERKSNGMNLWEVDAITGCWFSENYPQYNGVDSIRTVNRNSFNFIDNQNGLYDTQVVGEYEYYFQRLEKSDDPKVDSVITNYTIRKYAYKCLIGNDKSIIRMDVE